jgi:protoheme IX farnesyltransferase
VSTTLKASAQPLADAVVANDKSRLAVFSELFKARLTFLVLLTTLVGFYLGCTGPLDLLLLLHTMLGTALVAGGASALNQFLERGHDAKMERTADRPLPSGRMQPGAVLLLGAVCAGLGLFTSPSPSTC